MAAQVYESLSRSYNAPLSDRVVRLLSGGRAALVTDVDGTISPIVARPQDAFVLPLARHALSGLREVLTIVGVVSGRSVDDARGMVGVEGLVYVGNHGLEVWSNGRAETLPEARPWIPRVSAVLREVTQRLGPQDGVIVEDKGVTASIHYRLANDPDAIRQRLLELLARYGVTSGLRVEEGRRVINILPPLTVTKGSAVSWLVRQHDLDRMVYLGDDITDAHAFRALDVMRQSDHQFQALSIGVVGPETPPTVRELADAALPTVQAVAELLQEVLQGLSKSSDSMDVRAPTVGSD